MAEPLDFVVESEPSGVYRLEDGSVIRIRTVLMKVLFKGFSDDGTPLYDLRCQNCVDVESGEHVKKEPSRG